MLLVVPMAFAESSWGIGVGIAGAFDLPAAEPLEVTGFEPGGALLVPVRWTPVPGASLRIALEIGAAPGSDTVVWTDSATPPPVNWYSDSHWAMYGAARLLAGPELAVSPSANATPYLGVEGGLAAIATFHSFDETTAVLSDEGTGGLDPYTLQVVPAASVHVGGRFGDPGRVAVELELGYTLSFLPSAPLRQAPEDLDATRSAYALDVVRVGVGVALPL